MSKKVDVFLSLLENVVLTDGPLCLGDNTLQDFTPEELAPLLYARDVDSLTDSQRTRVREYSMFTWVRLDKPVSDEEPGQRGHPPGWDRLLEHFELAWGHSGTQTYYPFDTLIQTLNLLKPWPGPVMAIQYFHRPYEALAEKAAVEHIALREPTIQEDEYGHQWPYLPLCKLAAGDSEAYHELAARLTEALSKEGGTDENSRRKHLRIAEDLYERANRGMWAPTLDLIPPLLFFVFSIEALYIRDAERGGMMERLRKRVPPGIIPNGSVPTEDLDKFIKVAHGLRSKIAHGAFEPHEVQSKIRSEAPKEMFVEGLAFDDFLANLREIARRSIRFFLREFAEARSQEQTLRQLES